MLAQPQGASAQWDAFAGQGSGDQGGYTASFTSVSGTPDSTGDSVYTAHGTVTATLPANAQSAASGSVMLTVTF
jgi:hypothetical protein